MSEFDVALRHPLAILVGVILTVCLLTFDSSGPSYVSDDSTGRAGAVIFVWYVVWVVVKGLDVNHGR